MDWQLRFAAKNIKIRWNNISCRDRSHWRFKMSCGKCAKKSDKGKKKDDKKKKK